MKTTKWFQIIICGRVQPPLPIPKTNPPPHLLNFVECPFFVDFFFGKRGSCIVQYTNAKKLVTKQQKQLCIRRKTKKFINNINILIT